MKKFIKSEIDHTEISNRAQAAATSVAEKKAELPAPNVQTPLPLVSPPPDTPWTPVTVKQQIEDQEYKDSYRYEPKPLETQEQEDIKPRVVICRDYIRGTCKRIGTCKYAHKYDLSQLIGVYTFCRDFQTKRCTRAYCKYVHADVFEEQNFYRTGYLPSSSSSLQSNSLKRSWNALDTVSLLDPDLCYPKKCKKITEFCLQHSIDKLQMSIVNRQAIKVKIEQMDEKIAKLLAIIMPRLLNMPYTRDMSQ